MRIETEDWTDELKELCSERCAQMGEPACHKVDLWLDPLDPKRGEVCQPCIDALNLDDSKADRTCI